MIDQIPVSNNFTFENMEVLTIGEMLFDDLPNGRRPGGGPFNAAAHLNAMGTSAGLLSATGKDQLGKALLDIANRHNVNTSLIQQNSLPTSTVTVSLTEAGEATYKINKPVAWDALATPPQTAFNTHTPSVIAIWLLGIRDDRTFAAVRAFAKTFHNWQRSPKIVVDLGLRPPFCEKAQVEFLLTEAHVLKLNMEELAFFSNLLGLSADPLVLAKAYDIETILLTAGSEPAKSFTGGKTYKAEGPKVEVIDTVGCGDAFLAGYIHAMTKDLPEQQRLGFACNRGSYAASIAGGLP